MIHLCRNICHYFIMSGCILNRISLSSRNCHATRRDGLVRGGTNASTHQRRELLGIEVLPSVSSDRTYCIPGSSCYIRVTR